MNFDHIRSDCSKCLTDQCHVYGEVEWFCRDLIFVDKDAVDIDHTGVLQKEGWNVFKMGVRKYIKKGQVILFEWEVIYTLSIKKG